MTRWTMLAIAAASLAIAAHPAAAASAVTFVARAGTDAGGCTRAAPCRTFRYALTQTSSGGILTAIEPGGYAPVIITQSVTLAGPGKGGASMSPRESTSNTGIDIEAPGGTVILRGIEIDGGFNGITIGQAATVVISDTVIVGSSNLAINVSDASAKVLVQDVTVRNGEIDTYAATFAAKRVTVTNSPAFGINPLGGLAVLDDCTVTGSSSADVAVYGSTTFIKHGKLTNAGFRGIDVTAGSTGYVDSTTTFGNGQFSIIVGGTAYSYGNNNFPETTSGTVTPIAGD